MSPPESRNEAAKYNQAEEHEKAAHHAYLAHGHSQHAVNHGVEAAKLNAEQCDSLVTPHERWYRPYSIREAHHLLRDNPVHLNINSFGFTKPSESKDPSRRLVYLLRSPGGQSPRINPNGVF
jgi:hypothetical protein